MTKWQKALKEIRECAEGEYYGGKERDLENMVDNYEADFSENRRAWDAFLKFMHDQFLCNLAAPLWFENYYCEYINTRED